MQNKTFRLFVSSTFSDFNEERKLLQTIVFPEIKKYCRENSLIFQPIDLRWGVTAEASNDQKTLSLCLEEVQSSKDHPYPNFIIMAGDRYGWVPLPYAIEQNEYETILQIIDDSLSKELLNTWYILDENQIPASYILIERKKSDSSHDEVDYTNRDNWQKIENQLKIILQTSVQKSNLNEKQKRKYFTSATEAEVIEGIFRYLHRTKFQNKLLEKNEELEKIDFENVFAYIRNIKSLDNESFRDKFLDEDSSKVTDFKNEIKKSIDQSNILDVDINLRDIFQDSKNGSLTYKYETISNNEKSIFVEKMIGYLKSSIDKYIEKSKNISAEELEKYEQKRFKDSKLKDFLPNSRIEALTAIDNYINNDNNQALVIYGKSGLGKSSLMAKAIENVEDKYKDSKKVIYIFVGSTANLTNTPLILISILKELGIEEEIKTIINLQTGENKLEKIEEFYYRVKSHLSSIKIETLIFIDAIDQLSNKDEFLWLPNILPNNLKIIISVLEDNNYKEDSEYFENLKVKTTNLYSLEKFEEKNAEKLIKNILERYGRTVTQNQMNYLLNIYKSIKTPLYLSVAAQELRHWKSSYKVISEDKSAQVLASSQKKIIEEFIENLTKLYHHDKEFVKRVFSYLYLSDGLSESELLEIVSSDEEFLSKMAPDTYHKNELNELPVVIWARLYSQIKEFLKLETKDNAETMSFFHREFNDVISKQEDIKKHHEKLIELIQFLIEKHQYEPFDSNRWGEIFNQLWINYYKEEDIEYIINNENIFEKNLSFYEKILNFKYLEENLLYISKIYINYYNTYNSKLSLLASKFHFYICHIAFKKNNNDFYKEYLKSLNNIGYSLIRLKEYEYALKYAKASELLVRENPYIAHWNKEYSNSIIFLADCYAYDKNYEEALFYELKAYGILKEFYSEDIITTSIFLKNLTNLSNSYFDMCNYDNALKYANEAHSIIEEDKEKKISKRHHFLILNILLRIYSKIDEGTIAIHYGIDAYNIISEYYYNDNKDEWIEDYLTILNNLSLAFTNLNQGKYAYADSIEYAEEVFILLIERKEDLINRWEKGFKLLKDILESYRKISNDENFSEENNTSIEIAESIVDFMKAKYDNDWNKWKYFYIDSLFHLSFIYNNNDYINDSIKLLILAKEILEDLHVDEYMWKEYYLKTLSGLSELYITTDLKVSADYKKTSFLYMMDCYLEKPNFFYKEYFLLLSELVINNLMDISTEDIVNLEIEILEHNFEKHQCDFINKIYYLFEIYDDNDDLIIIANNSFKKIRFLYLNDYLIDENDYWEFIKILNLFYRNKLKDKEEFTKFFNLLLIIEKDKYLKNCNVTGYNKSLEKLKQIYININEPEKVLKIEVLKEKIK